MNIDFLISSLMYDPKNPMLFQSVLFFGAFSIFYLIYSFFNNEIKVRNALLLAFSLFFYYKISGGFVLALIFMASVDYIVGRNLPNAKSERKKIFEVLIERFRKYNEKLFNFNNLSDKSIGFSGAEIEQAIIEGMYIAFNEKREFE